MSTDGQRAAWPGITRNAEDLVSEEGLERPEPDKRGHPDVRSASWCVALQAIVGAQQQTIERLEEQVAALTERLDV
ncbi:MAG: hypothetical protein ACRDO4_10385 [Nocardioides sp.]